MKIEGFQKAVHENAKAHGWWDGEKRTFGELIALCHSELSEALEEFRKGKYTENETYYECSSPNECGECASGHCFSNGDCDYQKPCGIPSELADTVIRIMDMCGHYGIDLEGAIIEKHNYNLSRPYKHGGKVI